MAGVGGVTILVTTRDSELWRDAPRILFIVNDAAFFVSHRLPLAQAALRSGFSVHLAAPPGERLDEILEAGIVLHTLPLSRSSRNPIEELRTFAALIGIVRRVRPTVVHNVTIKAVLYGSFAARLTRVSRIVNAVSGRGYVFLARGFGSSIQRTVVRLLYRLAFSGRATRVIFQNADDLNEFTRHGLLAREKAVLIRGGSGVDLEVYRALPEPGPPITVVLAARMLADKGVREFVAAAKSLESRYPEVRFVLVGPVDRANPTAISEDTLNEWTRRGSVQWWGNKSDIHRIFAESHIICLPSYMEGMPKVLLEAAACARPVITTDVPGCRDAIVPGESGLLVPAKNAVALAAAIASLLDSPTERARLGLNGRRLAERCFDSGKVAMRTLALYEEMLR